MPRKTVSHRAKTYAPLTKPMSDEFQPSQAAPRCRRGLTLIEVLAAVAVLGILSAILIPVTSSARESARVATCQTNLRELGVAVYLYAADHDDYTPPNIDPYTGERADMAGNYIGGWGDDVRTLGWLIHEDDGGPRNSPNRYVDNPEVLVCPSLSDDVYAASDQYKRPEEISRDNILMRTGYAWIYRIPRDEEDENFGDGYFEENHNSRVTQENLKVPYAFDYGWKSWGDQGPIIGIPSHRNVMNVLHLGGHITTIPVDEANARAGIWDDLYRLLAGDLN